MASLGRCGALPGLPREHPSATCSSPGQHSHTWPALPAYGRQLTWYVHVQVFVSCGCVVFCPTLQGVSATSLNEESERQRLKAVKRAEADKRAGIDRQLASMSAAEKRAAERKERERKEADKRRWVGGWGCDLVGEASWHVVHEGTAVYASMGGLSLLLFTQGCM